MVIINSQEDFPYRVFKPVMAMAKPRMLTGRFMQTKPIPATASGSGAMNLVIGLVLRLPGTTNNEQLTIKQQHKDATTVLEVWLASGTRDPHTEHLEDNNPVSTWPHFQHRRSSVPAER